MISVFVYGTLKPGEVNYPRYCKPWVMTQRPAQTRGWLYALPQGYPAMTLGEGWVQGYHLTFTWLGILSLLDELEDYEAEREPSTNEYQRQQLDLWTLDEQPLGPAWVYVMRPEKIQQLGGILLNSGIWSPARSPHVS